MAIYKRIAAIECEEDREDVLDELIDRYGDVPPQVMNLLSISLARAAARRCKIVSIVEEQSVIKIRPSKFDFNVWQMLSDENRGRLRVIASEQPTVNFLKKSGENAPEMMRDLFERYYEIEKQFDPEDQI